MEIRRHEIVPSLRQWTDRDGLTTPLGSAAANEIERLRSALKAIHEAVKGPLSWTPKETRTARAEIENTARDALT
jgi:hypothetical protein